MEEVCPMLRQNLRQMKAINLMLTMLAALFLIGCAQEPEGEIQKYIIQDQSPIVTDGAAPAPEPVVEEIAEVPSDAPVDLGGIGVGPISSIELAEIDTAIAAEGKAIFKIKCRSCHKLSKRFVGPELGKVLQRRRPEWVMNMMLNPEKMVEEDPVAKALLEEYISPMANQSLTEEEATKILEYIRNYDATHE